MFPLVYGPGKMVHSRENARLERFITPGTDHSMMNSKIRSGLTILSNEGGSNLFKRAVLDALARTSYGDDYLFDYSKSKILDRSRTDETLDDIVRTAVDVTPGVWPYHLKAMQLKDELTELSTLVKKHDPETVLEIGTANGGTLYTWCKYLETVSDIVSLDLPGGDFGGGYPKRKQQIYNAFSGEKDTHFVRADSHSEQTLKNVRSIIENESYGGTVDFLFIDGDHTYEGVKTDFEMYGELVSEEGIIALHDIVEHPDDRATVTEMRDKSVAEPRYLKWGRNHPSVNVNKFWNELQDKYSTMEIIAHQKQTWGGIGVVYF